MRHSPERTCIGCRTVCPASELVRLIAPDGRVRVVQVGHRYGASSSEKRGRGAWVHPRCLAAALKSMGRAFRRQVEVLDRETLLAQVHSASGQSINAQGDLR
jgi:hypothetical protein